MYIGLTDAMGRTLVPAVPPPAAPLPAEGEEGAEEPPPPPEVEEGEGEPPAEPEPFIVTMPTPGARVPRAMAKGDAVTVPSVWRYDEPNGVWLMPAGAASLPELSIDGGTATVPPPVPPPPEAEAAAEGEDEEMAAERKAAAEAAAEAAAAARAEYEENYGVASFVGLFYDAKRMLTLSVRQAGWWAVGWGHVDNPSTTHTLSMRLVACDQPLSDALVAAVGVSYFGKTYARTDASGKCTIAVNPGSQVRTLTHGHVCAHLPHTAHQSLQASHAVVSHIACATVCDGVAGAD